VIVLAVLVKLSGNEEDEAPRPLLVQETTSNMVKTKVLYPGKLAKESL
jgi:hypothetical protein